VKRLRSRAHLRPLADHLIPGHRGNQRSAAFSRLSLFRSRSVHICARVLSMLRTVPQGSDTGGEVPLPLGAALVPRIRPNLLTNARLPPYTTHPN